MKNSDIQIVSCGYCTQYEKFIAKSGKLEKIKFPANSFLIPLTEGFILFDTGYAANFDEYKTNFLVNLYSKILPTNIGNESSCYSQLKSKGIDTDNIKYVFISHFHPDHTGGLKDFREQKFLCSRNEYKNLKGIRKNFAELFLPKDFESRVVFVEDFEEDRIFPEFKSYKIESDVWAVCLPGHTQYQYGIYSGKNNVLIVADAIWSDRAYKKSEYPSRFAMNIMENKKLYKETVEKLKALYERENVRILYSHQEDVL